MNGVSVKYRLPSQMVKVYGLNDIHARLGCSTWPIVRPPNAHVVAPLKATDVVIPSRTSSAFPLRLDISYERKRYQLLVGVWGDRWPWAGELLSTFFSSSTDT